jgi:hypothetical protein
MNVMKNVINVSILLFALAFAAACEDDEIPQLALEGDYLPVDQNSRYFLREQFSDPDLSNRFQSDTIRIEFVGDTVIANKTYHQYKHFSFWDSGNGIIDVNYDYRFFRKEGSQYIEPLSLSGDGTEIVFLDTEKPVGCSWSYDNGFGTETIYTIKAVNTEREINGIQYMNVIDVEMETRYHESDGSYSLVYKGHRYFEKDLGEIYSLSEWYMYRGAFRLSDVKKK